MKYNAIHSSGGVNIPFSFTVKGDEGKERIDEFHPEPLRESLQGQALLAYKKFRLLLLGQIEAATLLNTNSHIVNAEYDL